ncbi:unnamed protein product, partial [Staurois parvus]
VPCRGAAATILEQGSASVIGVSGRNSAPSLVSLWCQWEESCPIIGVSGRNSVPSLVSVGGIVPHHWCQSEESCPIIGVSGRNSTPS